MAVKFNNYLWTWQRKRAFKNRCGGGGATETIMLRGAAPTCTFPCSRTLLSSWDGLQLRGHGCRHETVKGVHNGNDNEWEGFKWKRGEESSMVFRHYLPYVYGMGGVFSDSIWWRRGVKILQASRSSSLGERGRYFRNSACMLHQNVIKMHFNQPANKMHLVSTEDI